MSFGDFPGIDAGFRETYHDTGPGSSGSELNPKWFQKWSSKWWIVLIYIYVYIYPVHIPWNAHKVATINRCIYIFYSQALCSSCWTTRLQQHSVSPMEKQVAKRKWIKGKTWYKNSERTVSVWRMLQCLLGRGLEVPWVFDSEGVTWCHSGM